MRRQETASCRAQSLLWEPTSCAFTRFASGLHEPLGLAVRAEQREGKPVTAVYCVQRGELTRMTDVDGDGRADLYETVCDGWGVSGNYHEFAFGPKFDAKGNDLALALIKKADRDKDWKVAVDGKITGDTIAVSNITLQ